MNSAMIIRSMQPRRLAMLLVLLSLVIPSAAPARAGHAAPRARIAATGADSLFSLHVDSLISTAHGTILWGDYDNDGQLDLFINGMGAQNYINFSRLYHNSNGTFVETPDTFIGVHNK